jgi:SAM-dependent methyltransferase
MNTRPLRIFGVRDADDYWRKRRAVQDMKERRLHRFLAGMIDSLFPGGGARVLDCGVGDGHTFRLCSARHDVWGVEQSAEAIAMSGCPAERLRQADLNHGIPDFGRPFDVVLSSHVLHWLENPGLFLDQARQALSPGGRLVLLVPNITNYHHRLRFLFGVYPPVSLSHRNFQTPGELEEMARDHGWIIHRRTTPKPSIKAKLWPKLFAADLVYVLAPTGTRTK